MADMSDADGRKKCGALVVALLFCVCLLGVLSFIVVAIRSAGRGSLVLVFHALVIVSMIVGTVVALVLRFREIDSGEEHEARKY